MNPLETGVNLSFVGVEFKTLYLCYIIHEEISLRANN
jgi:hypothetical protein